MKVRIAAITTNNPPKDKKSFYDLRLKGDGNKVNDLTQIVPPQVKYELICYQSMKYYLNGCNYVEGIDVSSNSKSGHISKKSISILI